MFYINVWLDLVLICCLCSTGLSLWTKKPSPYPSFVLGGNPDYDTENDNYGMNCSQFTDDFDILSKLPFRIRVDPDIGDSGLSVAELHNDRMSVRMIELRREKFLPSSLFCLSKLHDLTLFNVSFKDNTLPDGVANLQTLTQLNIYNASNLKIGDQLSKLKNLSIISLAGCSLTSLPDISHLNLSMLDVQHNNLTHFKRPITTSILFIDHNSFQTLPLLSNPERISLLTASHNPIKSVTPILEYKNLKMLSVSNADITFIPPNIDRLEKLEAIDLSNNKLTHLPINILNLPLKLLYVSSNAFSPVQIQSIKKAIEKHHPNIHFEI